MHFYSYLEISNTITEMQENFDSDKTLIDYTIDLDTLMSSKISNSSLKLHTMKYGLAEIELFVYEFFDDNYKTDIRCKVTIEDDYGELTDNDIFDLFDSDTTFTDALIYNIHQFILDIEKELKSIKIPINTKVTYIDGCLYAKITDESVSIEWDNLHFNRNTITNNELSINSYSN